MTERAALRILVTAMGGDADALRRRILHIAPRIQEVAVCAVPEAVRDIVRFDDFHAVIVDWRLGGRGAGSILAVVKACPLIPVIVVSNEPESAVSEHMLRLGVQDYLVKRETNGAQLVRAIHHAMERKHLDVRLKASLGELGQANARLRSLALRDTLTGALNRRAFMVIATQMLARADRHARRLALLYCDLDGFKQINDRLGHAAGDRVLEAFCARCRQVVRRGDVMARLGGDEFVILLESVNDAAMVERTARRIRTTSAEPIAVGSITVSLTASIGMAWYPDCPDMKTLIAAADQAMYAAKRAGGVAWHRVDDTAHAGR